MLTRDDVAKYAGVSKSTVSRVLNNSGYVSAENRKKIEEAIETLGYKPNLIARSLKTKETRQILFCASELSNPFYMEVYQGMEDFARQNGYTIVVSQHFDHSMVRQRQFDGIVLSGVSPKEQDALLHLNIPVVVTDYSGQPLKIPSVSIVMEDGALRAVDYLTRCNHRRIAFITNVSSRDDQRYKGYIKGLKNANIPLSPSWVQSGMSGKTAYEQGYKAGLELIRNGVDVTAVFAFNDMLAIGAMAAFWENSLSIPGHVSFIGFDNILQAQYTHPPLTTIHIPKYEQGWESAKMLIKLIREEKVEPITLNTELVIRKSVEKLG